MKTLAARITGAAIVIFARVITAPRAIWAGTDPVPRKRVYYSNHTSNADFVLLWAVLPPALRQRTRPVAAADYWLTSKLRAFAGRDVFRAVLIDRNPDTRKADPVTLMVEALDEGSSLIIFPEGNRNMGTDPLLPFKTGLFHLATARPDVDLVPVWLDNLNSVMPKGEIVPLPLLCTVTYGAPLHLQPNEDKTEFLTRARNALLDLKPGGEE
ncbi:MAG: lysophospholipid acyltransferase family protein [Maritimibacter sp.]